MSDCLEAAHVDRHGVSKPDWTGGHPTANICHKANYHLRHS